MIIPMLERQSILSRLNHYQPKRQANLQPIAEGRITRAVGLTLEAVGLNLSLGHQCEVINSDHQKI